MLRMPPSPPRRAQGASPGLNATCVGESVGAIVCKCFCRVCWQLPCGFACICLCGLLLHSLGRRILFFAARLLKSSNLQRRFLLPLMIYSTKLWLYNFPGSFWVYIFLGALGLVPHGNALTEFFFALLKTRERMPKTLGLLITLRIACTEDSDSQVTIFHIVVAWVPIWLPSLQLT